MLLVLDVGNTQTVIGLFDGDDMVGHWRLTTTRERTADELRMWLKGMLELEGFRPTDVHGVALSSVVPALTAPLRAVGGLVAGEHVVVVEPGVKTGMPILIDNPREVGADRVVNSVAARQRYGTPVIVVDFGTSTNFDVVRRRRRLPRRCDRARPRRLRPTRSIAGSGGAAQCRVRSATVADREGHRRGDPERCAVRSRRPGRRDHGTAGRRGRRRGDPGRHRRAGLYHRAALPQRRDRSTNSSPSTGCG